MTIPDELQRLVDAGTLTLKSNGPDEEAYFEIPALARDGRGGDSIWYEVCLWTDGEVSIDKNSRFGGPSEAFTGDVDSAVAWIEEQIGG